jgi:hypothetical protein
MKFSPIVGSWHRGNVLRIVTREVGVALHIGADDGNERLPFQPGDRAGPPPVSTASSFWMSAMRLSRCVDHEISMLALHLLENRNALAEFRSPRRRALISSTCRLHGCCGWLSQVGAHDNPGLSRPSSMRTSPIIAITLPWQSAACRYSTAKIRAAAKAGLTMCRGRGQGIPPEVRHGHRGGFSKKTQGVWPGLNAPDIS